MSVTATETRTGAQVESRNVTGADSARARLVKSRNLHRLDWRLMNAARQEAAEQVKAARETAGEGADLFAFMDALRKYDVPEEEEAAQRVREAQRGAKVCGQCGDPIEAGDPVFIAPRVYTGMATLVKQPNFHRAAVCANCAPVDITERAGTRGGRAHNIHVDEPCFACRRPVVFRTTYGLYNRRRRIFCCGSCQWTYYNTARNERSAQAREKVCEVCGGSFTASRRDAKTCSGSCKQKAYRRRKDAA